MTPFEDHKSQCCRQETLSSGMNPLAGGDIRVITANTRPVMKKRVDGFPFCPASSAKRVDVSGKRADVGREEII